MYGIQKYAYKCRDRQINDGKLPAGAGNLNRSE
jgi:hypothetical protein